MRPLLWNTLVSDHVRRLRADGAADRAALGEELHMPCNAWNAIERCDIAVPAAQRAQFDEDIIDFSVACGAASQLLTA